jgi:trehalose 6-phosphate phosphatase
VSGYDDPIELARLVAAAARPVLIGLDVDGVLAPLVAHADDAALLEGMADSIGEIAGLDAAHVAVVSGRSIADLERFGFGDDVEVIGSHGNEVRGRPTSPLDVAESARLAALDRHAVAAAATAGEGAWVERKPASVVLHVRQADRAAGDSALEQFGREAAAVPGAATKPGSRVLEAFARSADKGLALLRRAAECGAATTVFVGDDVTDEDAFARLGPRDIAIKVGDAPTIAPHRLADPAAVLAWLRALAHC